MSFFKKLVKCTAHCYIGSHNSKLFRRMIVSKFSLTLDGSHLDSEWSYPQSTVTHGGTSSARPSAIPRYHTRSTKPINTISQYHSSSKERINASNTAVSLSPDLLHDHRANYVVNREYSCWSTHPNAVAADAIVLFISITITIGVLIVYLTTPKAPSKYCFTIDAQKWI